MVDLRSPATYLGSSSGIQPACPLIQRLDVIPLTSQFPSTTTAHVPSVHFGMPVHEHGLYEWNILEPALGEIICPLRFNPAGAEEEGTLVGRLEPSVLSPGPTFYESLAVPCIVAQPSRLAGSFTAVATRGAQVIGFRRLREGVCALGEAFAAPVRVRWPRPRSWPPPMAACAFFAGDRADMSRWSSASTAGLQPPPSLSIDTSYHSDVARFSRNTMGRCSRPTTSRKAGRK